LLGVVLVVLMVRKKVSKISVRAGGVEAQVRTHKAEVPTISNIEQISEAGENEANFKNPHLNVNGVSQKAQGNNSLSIGAD